MVSHSTFKLLSRTADIPLPDLWIAIPHTEPNNGPTDTQQESPAMEQNTFQQSTSVAQDPTILHSEHTCPKPPRVPVTGSMLYAYAAMRGNVDKDRHELNPLHSSLYLNPIQCVNSQFELPMNLPQWQCQNDNHMSQELQPGTVFFNDVSGPMYLSPAPPQRYLQGDDFGGKPLRYDDYKHRNPPEHRPNHYKGDEGYGNYGYFQVNDCWVDPESRKEIHDALNNRAPPVPRLPIGTIPCPGLYEDEIYKSFMAEINGEDGDGEGDPRAMYITSATFARWAAGASEGDYYVEATVPPQNPPLRELCSRTRTPKPPLPRHQCQYCHETGSAFTGEYSPESNPSLCMSSRGVDMTNQPRNFSLSYPQGAIDLDRAAYGGSSPNDKSKAKVADWLASSTVSTLIPFTEENAIKHLADPNDTDPNAGLKKWNEHIDWVNSLQSEFRDDLLRSVDKKHRRFEGIAEAQKLYKEAYFMEKRLDKRDLQMGTPTPRRSITKAASRPTLAKPPQPKFRQADETTPTRGPRRKDTREHYPQAAAKPSSQPLPTKPSPEASRPGGSPPRQPLRHKGQFVRYFTERHEREQIYVNKQKMANLFLDVDIKDINEGVQDLKAIHTQYRTSLGVESVSEIPDLIPQRKKTPDPKEGN